MRTLKALIIGKGAVGTALGSLLGSKGWHCECLGCRDDRGALTAAIIRSDAVFVAISTRDDGEAELAYLMRCVELDTPVITCAKGALAYRFEALKPHLGKIGFTATVGGGSEILPLAFHHPDDMVEEIWSIQNGTVNFLCWALQRGMSVKRALEEARKLQLPEPGSATLKEVFEAEHRDMLMKAAITSNVAGIQRIISPDDFSHSRFEGSFLKEMMRKRGNRFVLEIRRVNGHRFSFEPFSLHLKPWLVIGSFVRNARELFPGLATYRQSNAMRVRRKESGIHSKSGLGAGSEPTAQTMFNDAKRLLKIE